MTASFQFKIDNFRVVKNGTTIFDDPFDSPPDGGGNPPLLDAPSFSNGAPGGYVTFGDIVEKDGSAILDGAGSVNSAPPGLDVFSISSAVLPSGTTPGANTLSKSDDFQVEGRFSLILPDDKREGFGIRLGDRTATLPGDDVYDLAVVRGTDNVLRVRIAEFDYVAGRTKIVDWVPLNAGSNDEIVLRFTHTAANPGKLIASFDLLTLGVVTSSTQLTFQPSIFGVGTPDTGDDEDFALAQFIAFSPDPDFSGPNVMEGDQNPNIIVGTTLADRIYGYDGHDRLAGKENEDILLGGDGNDKLDGGAGADTLFGEAGDDTYFVDVSADQASETDGGGADSGGFDTVVSTASFTLGSFIENLALKGTDNLLGAGNALDNRIDGNAGDNQLAGNGGNDQLFGHVGNDTLGGGDDNDTLFGGSGNDELFGGGGNDRMDGEAGSDEMRGGAGDDTYFVDEAADQVIETGVGGVDTGGIDTVISLVTWTLTGNVEHLTLKGSNDIDGTGNSAANKLLGNNGSNKLSGGANNDTLSGGAGNDNLVGDVGNDILSGGQGQDTLSGGADNDLLNGAAGDDNLDGGAGSDTLMGAAGADTLAGGADADQFRFKAGEVQGDLVADFESGVDHLDFWGFDIASAALIQLTADSWQVSDGVLTETFTTGNGVVFTLSDFTFHDTTIVAA